jgi:hypothetical protein
MKSSFHNKLLSSFYLWFDHRIAAIGGGFYNHSGALYQTQDPNFDNNTSIYASPYRQWVYDSSVPGAFIPSGIYVDNTEIDKATSGLAIDFNKGRVIFDNHTVNVKNISAKFSYKEYNLYYTDEKEETLLFEKAPTIMSMVKSATQPLGYLDIPFPCIFIKNTFNQNEPFAFGGQHSTSTSIRCIVLASNSFSLDSLSSIMTDSLHQNFPVLESSELPFNRFGDLRNINFNYIDVCKTAPRNNLAFIEKVSVSKLEEIDNGKMNKKCISAFIDFDISNIRYIS